MGIPLKKLIPQVHAMFLYAFLFVAPLQVRYIFFSRDWYFNEWRSMSLYASDILFGALIVLWILQMAVERDKIQVPRPQKSDYALGIFFGFAVFSLGSTADFSVSFYGLCRLAQGILLFFYIRMHAVRFISGAYAALVLVLSGTVQAVVAIAQYIGQSDIGLRLLGEGLLSPAMRGVAVFHTTTGEKVMRAYGTMPHPNILAAVLLVSLFALYYLYFTKSEAGISHKHLKVIGQLSAVICYIVLLWGFLLTFSRTAIFAWAAGLGTLAAFLLLRKKKDKSLRVACIGLIAVTAVACLAFAFVFWPEVVARLTVSGSEEAVTLRIYYSEQALESGYRLVNWSGVGIGNFVGWFMAHTPNRPWYIYQPVHNIYLLAYTELGVFGAISFILFLGFLLWENVRRKQIDASGAGLLILISAILFIGFFDHFPWTLQQGRFLFWGLLGLLAGKNFHAEKTEPPKA